MRHAYGNADIHSDGNSNCHIHANSDCNGNRHVHTDGNRDGNVYADTDGNSNCVCVTATFADATASSDAAAACEQLL